MSPINFTILRALTITIVVSFFVFTGIAAEQSLQTKLSDDFERAVQKYEEAFKLSPPKSGCTLFVGSSSFALWGKKLEAEFADRNAVNRGFGGSTFPDNLLAIDRIHIPCRPARVVIFCGTNDFANGASVDEVFANFRAYLARLWKVDPRIEVFFVSVTHAPAREHLWAKGDALNELIQELASKTSVLTFIDIISPMNAASERGENLFGSDRLHLNDTGYAVWAQTFREAFAAQDARNSPTAPTQ